MAPRNPIKRDIDDLSSDCSSDSFRKSSKIKRTHSLDKDSDEYKKRRERNNLAVKKSRSKTKLKTQQTVERVNQLREENEMLEAKIKILTKELSFLKDLFLAHAGSAHGQNLTDAELNYLKSDVDLKTVNADANHSA
ncbi:CCAAT/enhancer-binding protein gamma like protein [Argiope bruennichi]|uniref:CCAAT/enhancer-binding protein gamma like protein n=1 Tax=Argiope bruennichi TaxID=94029 RepID=A0A8T0FCR9_ARGBR|nr:CCAAT/enhancer-binding protein gamma like protein [Argiope bruennichi]